MAIGAMIQAWRLSKGHTVSALAAKAALSAASLEAIEAGEADPPVSALEQLARALGIPVSWLFGDPKQHDLLADPDNGEDASSSSVDPVLEHVLTAVQEERSLYVLLTALFQSGDPKLIRAAEVSLRSLVKQSKQATVPWQNRPPGHFEPPSD